MTNRIEEQAPAGEPVIIEIADRSFPFAGRDHPGWVPFFKKLRSKKNPLSVTKEWLDTRPDLDESFRKELLTMAFNKLVEDGDDETQALIHPGDIENTIAMLSLGLSLVNPDHTHEEWSRFVGGLTLRQYYEIRFLG